MQLYLTALDEQIKLPDENPYYYKKHWWKSDKFKENVVMGIMLAGYICVVWWLFKWSLG